MAPYGKTTLPNGVRIVTGRMEGVKSASLIIAYNVGSRIEPAPIAGAAHFLEHMLFKGTSNRPDPMIISQEIESVGGILNAGTGRENTSYWAKVPGVHLALAFDVLADMMLNSTFDPDEMEKERKVIFEEIRAIQDIPEDLVHDVIDQLVWGDDPVGRDVAGTEETVANIDREAMVDFFLRNYGADRLVIAAGGDVQHDEVVALAEKYFGDLSVTINPHTNTLAKSDQNEKRIRLLTRDTEQAHLCIGFPALSYHDERRYVQSTIEAILSSGMSSRLFQEIREKRGLVYSVYGYFRSHEDIGQGVIYAGTDTERVNETITAIMGELKKLRDEPVPEEELERTKTLRKGRLLMGLEDSRSVASWVGSQESTYGYIETPEEMMVHIDSVTTDQVQELANDLIKEEMMNLVLIGPYTRERDYLPLLTLD
ncbi:MAG: insulinase family protein [Thermomicrobiales bacterium]|nr:insulinase family protein [Thermomicrobiales bacterium]MCO5218024.1 insulinase family protein [Thermomicrobiales bacterium]MCO5224391.1 insulinase family protein [Thermomicrobiales bacterium]MCO5228243.1 insulinase family protein [Thermomicrobiales bacterium]